MILPNAPFLMRTSLAPSQYGYLLHDRVVRPAEVGVTVAVDNEESDA